MKLIRKNKMLYFFDLNKRMSQRGIEAPRGIVVLESKANKKSKSFNKKRDKFGVSFFKSGLKLKQTARNIYYRVRNKTAKLANRLVNDGRGRGIKAANNCVFSRLRVRI